jgi:hypothetical protein
MATQVQNPFDTQQPSPTNQNIQGGTQPMTTGAPGATPYKQFNPTPSVQPQTYTAQTSQVNAPTETMQGQVSSILSQDNPLMQRARALATQQMGQRGLINSSMAQGAGVAAMVDRALPIAQQDAQTYNQRALVNQDATNQANQFNVGQTNQMFQFGQDLAGRFGMQREQQSFQAGESALDRAQQTQLQTNQFSFQGTQADMDRSQQTRMQELQESGLDFRQAREIVSRESMAELDRDFQMRVQTLQESGMDFRQARDLALRESEGALDRDFQMRVQSLQESGLDFRQARDLALRESEAALDRGFQMRVLELQESGLDFRQARDIASREYMAQEDRTFQAGENQIQRDFNERISVLEQQGLDFRQAREIASREAITQLEQQGITNRFDQELALKSDMFNAEQINLERRQITENKARLDELGLRIDADKQTIPTQFAANISNTTMAGVSSIMGDTTLTAAAKQTAVNNLINYANAQIAWAEKFYATTIPRIGSATVS